MTEPDEHAPAYRLAFSAARLRQHATAGGSLDLRDLGVAALLLHAGTSPRELRRLAESAVLPLRTHDQCRHTELVAILQAWLSAGCATSTAATALVVHLKHGRLSAGPDRGADRSRPTPPVWGFSSR